MANKLDFLKQFDQLTALFPVQGNARAVIHNGLDFPTTRDEYWKYTRVTSLVESEYVRNVPNIDSIDAFRVPGLDAQYLVFVNGEYSKKFSDTEHIEGVEVTSMRLAEGERKQQMLQHLDQYIDSETQAFHALNTSYFLDGSFITVEKNTSLSKPICILNICAGKRQANNIRNLIVVGEMAKAEFISLHEGHENEGSFTNAVTELKVEQGGDASLYLIQNDGPESAHINAIQVVQEKDSQSKVVTITRTGKLVRNNLNFTVAGQGCESNMYGVYFTSDKQHVDNHTYVDHLVPNCNSNELYKGVMSDRSTGVFNGKIMVHRDAQQTNAFQSNQNILLSERATINTKPELEIYADDVKCSHGCTIGQLDEEAMFYLQTRGLGKAAAAKLLVQAFSGDVTAQITNDALRDMVEGFLHQKFEDQDA
ncbi:MAG: Fe-S cluster assembly protein SufD [Flavobacteriales bacterium]|nr:Fe-S cluster assembly protein SufD [Flavobacteriales bacterium]